MAETLLNLRARVRQAANVENDEVVTDPEVDGYINAVAKRLWRKMNRAEETQIVLTADVTLESTAAGNREDLPVGFWFAVGLDFSPDTDAVCEVRSFNFAARNDVGYRGWIAQNDELIVMPWRNAAGTYRLYYVPDYTALADDADELPAMLDRLDEYIVTGAAIKVKDKREQNTESLQRELAGLEAEVAPTSKRRQSDPVAAAVVERFSGLSGYGDDPARGPRG